MKGPRNCVMCRRGLYRGRYQQHILAENLLRARPEFASYVQQHAVLEVAFDGTRLVCHRCWQRIENNIRLPPLPQHVEEPNVVEPPMQGQVVQELQVAEYTRAPNTPAHCIFNDCVNESRHRIPECIKVHILCECKLYILMAREYAESTCREIVGKNFLISAMLLIALQQPSLVTFVTFCELISNAQRFQSLSANELEYFPIVSEEQIIVFALGTYQLKLARSYCAEHIRNGLYLIEVYRENDLDDLPDYGMDGDVWLLRGRIQSRHVRSRIYYCYNLVNNNENKPIVQHYCTCLTGRRTMGTCAHTLSIIWYLGHARHVRFTAPAAFLNDVIDDET